MSQRRPPVRSRFRTISGAGAVVLVALATFAIAGGSSWSGMVSTAVVATRSTVAGAAAAVVASAGADVPSAPPRPSAVPGSSGRPTERETPRADPGSDSPSGLGRSTPQRLRIDAIGVDTDLVGLGLEPDGTMEVPEGAFPAGWYRGAPTPGELGPAVIVGHVDFSGEPGVFVDLAGLHPGDEVAVSRADGTTAVFAVTQVRRVAKDAFPTTAVYGDLDHPGLRLITCGGAFDREAASYEDNVIAFAELRHVVDAATAGPDRYSSSVGAPPS
ncbi:MAG TPA: class F sortase [Egicoccus sp.]|nr:class F sortase [Egicoccus sp.]HSK23779.1 class F sortase [Egicoccus sp.]